MENTRLWAGKNKAKWKGGETTCNGYVYIYSPLHPNKNKMGKGYVKRARLVMEKTIGRFLSKDEIVHHVDGNRSNDSLSNLTITTLSVHQSEHQKETAMSMKRDKNGRFERKSHE